MLAYVAHGLRGPEVDAREAARVGELAALLGADGAGLPHVVLPVEVRRTGDGPEADARRARHAALEAEADRRGIAHVVHGHHAEDQAETLLLRLARGSGPDGLAGMAQRSGRRLRPALDVRRADLHRAAEALCPGVLAGATHDPMNDDVAVARVRLRAELLPALGRVAPDPVGAIARLAALAKAEAELLDAQVAELRRSVPIVSLGPATLVRSAELRALHPAHGRRLLRALLPPGEARAAGSVERLLVAVDGWRATLPGPLDAWVDRGWHIVRPATASGAGVHGVDPDGVAPGGAPLPLVEGLQHPASGITFRVTTSGPAASRTAGAALLQVVAQLPEGVPPGLVVDRLTVRLREVEGPAVRTRRDGDRVRTPGGTRMLGDVLAEAGVPYALRDLLPVVVDRDDRVRWVPGVVVDAPSHVRPDPAGE